MGLAVTHYKAKTSSWSAPELVLIHGWGTSQIIWQHWLGLLRSRCNVTLIDLPGYGINAEREVLSLEPLLAELADVLPDKCIVLGYSLGGMLAVKLAEKFPEKIMALIALSSNAQFVASPTWPVAMTTEDYQNFYSLVEKNTTLALKRFSGFQAHGAFDEKGLIKKLRLLQERRLTSAHVLSSSLQLLAGIDNVEAVRNLSLPALYLFGEKDSLVPSNCAEKISVLPSSVIKVLPELPHCLFYADPDLVWQTIETFLLEHQLLSEIPADD